MKAVIIGSGHASITAARTLIQNDDDADITIVTEDRFPYYPRPSVYKIILGDKPEEITLYPKKWYSDNGISLELNQPIIDVKPNENKIIKQDKSEIEYEKLLIATGSRPFMPPIPGIDDGPVYCLRSIDDALLIRERALNCETQKATILGGGLLSVELTKSLSDIGILPTVIDRSPYLLRKQLDAEGGLFFNKILDKTLNAKFLFNSVCQRIHRNGEKMKIEIRSNEGDSNHNCEFFLNATGVRNDNTLPLKAGITLGKYAIKVDPFMRTNFKNIFAAGDAVDIDAFPGSKFGIIPTAIDQAKVAAVNMLGNQLPYTGTVPWTTLKVAGIDLTSIGEVKFDNKVEEVGTINDPEKGVYRKLFFKNQKLQGVILIGTKKNIHTLRRMTIKHSSIKEVKDEIQIS
jgi:nitrite reductase (NADH) large subunit